MKHRQRKLPAVVPVRALAPTMLTLLALCSGVTAIRFAFLEQWEAAAVALLVAALFDSLDGRVARLIKGETRFGAELDSLSDVICFGVAPAVVMHLWSLHALQGLGWAVVLLFCICCALRLARFNIMDQDAAATGTVERFFVGVPAPAAAILTIMPMALTFQTGSGAYNNAVFCSVYVAAMAVLMVSRVPTFSVKYVRIDRAYVIPVLVATGVLAALLTSYFWGTLVGAAVLYLLSLPISAMLARRRARR